MNNDALTNFVEAGLRLTEREILRARYIMRQGEPLETAPYFRRFTADENLLAELLADPEKAAAYVPFYADRLGVPDPASAPPGPIQPWRLEAPAGPAPERHAANDDTAALKPEDRVALLDFQGRAAAFMAGAAVVGAAALDERFLYTRTFAEGPGRGRAIERADVPDFQLDGQAMKLPLKADRVLALGFVMNPKIMGMTPTLSRIRPRQGWLDPPGQAAAVSQVAAFLRARGFMAWPSGGGLFMANQMAALAGLGEVGRQGLLISPEYGPNLRLFTILTDYPFAPDRAMGFGVVDYCNTCQRCINECPAKAIVDGRRRLTDEGLFQWPLDRRACFDNWLRKKDPCQKCVEICPYTREPLAGAASI